MFHWNLKGPYFFLYYIIFYPVKRKGTFSLNCKIALIALVVPTCSQRLFGDTDKRFSGFIHLDTNMG